MVIDELSYLKEKALIGDINSILSLYDLALKDGDFSLAHKYIDLAIFYHSDIAFHKKGYLYEKGLGVKVDLEKAEEYYRLGVSKNDPSSIYNLSLLLIKKDNNNTEAYTLLKNNVLLHNHYKSAYLLSKLYFNKDNQLSFAFLNKAFDINKELDILEPKLCYELGRYYQKGIGTDINHKKAYQYFLMGSQYNDPLCLLELSIYTKNGIVADKNSELSEVLYKKAVEHGLIKK
ncbi:MAG: hypothetical protein MJ227_00045 [Bacilli bacterium]|nr:hypothetical protein [Bacilli bacterium]